MVVTDSGQGIPQDRLDRIFAPFHTTKAAGLGVGLPMVKRTVERLGGRIDVSSRLGAGTTFRLTLPMASR
jgi:signal transduction histidine kinase